MNRFVAFVAFMVIASQPCAADEFCDVLFRVVDDAPSGFDHLRWKPETPRVIPKLPTMPGNCVIVPNGLGGPFHYVCLFPFTRIYMDEQTHTLASDTMDYHPVTNRIETCLADAGRSHTEQPPQNIEKFRLSTDKADIVIGVRYPHDSGDVYYALEINQKL